MNLDNLLFGLGTMNGDWWLYRGERICFFYHKVVKVGMLSWIYLLCFNDAFGEDENFILGLVRMFLIHVIAPIVSLPPGEGRAESTSKCMSYMYSPDMSGNQAIRLSGLLAVFVEKTAIETLVASNLHPFGNMGRVDSCSVHRLLIGRIKQGGLF